VNSSVFGNQDYPISESLIWFEILRFWLRRERRLFGLSKKIRIESPLHSLLKETLKKRWMGKIELAGIGKKN